MFDGLCLTDCVFDRSSSTRLRRSATLVSAYRLLKTKLTWRCYVCTVIMLTEIEAGLSLLGAWYPHIALSLLGAWLLGAWGAWYPHITLFIGASYASHASHAWHAPSSQYAEMFHLGHPHVDHVGVTWTCRNVALEGLFDGFLSYLNM